MTHQRRSLPRTALAALLLAAGTATGATADTPPKVEPSAEKGLAIAERLCGNCHLVEGMAGAAVPAGVPSMKGLANRPEQTGQRIQNALIQPHTPMPDIRLSMDEINHIIAYLETLRTNAAVPPLLPPASPKKPTYPKPS